MPGPTQPHELTALDQADALRRGELGVLELTEHVLTRIEHLDARLGAFAMVTAQGARAGAGRAQIRLRAGGRLPPLLGVPTAIKDLALTAGVPTGFGSRAYAGFVPELDDDAARLLREAGLVSVGKTATPEFGLPPYTEPAGRPPAITPWDPTRLAGGSSGGAAAAVAGGLVAVAHGTDGGGSIRIPAACCGLVGLKTSRGLVSRGPVGGDPLGMSVSGPIARTVTDAAALLDAMAVPVPGEPYAPAARSASYLDAARTEPTPLRVGRYHLPPVPGAEVDPVCLAAYERVSALLADLGHAVVDVGSGIGADLLPVFETLWAVLSHATPVPPGTQDLLQPLTVWMRERGAAVSAVDYLAATQAAITLTRRIVRAHADAVDVVLTPMLAQLPRPVGWFTEGGDPAQDFERQKRFTPFTAAYNLTGQPALSLPVAWGRPVDAPHGPQLPVSVQLVGLPGADGLLLCLGAQLHAALDWDAQRRPPLW